MPLSKLQSRAAERGTGKNLHCKENFILWPKVQVAKTGSVNLKADLQLLLVLITESGDCYFCTITTSSSNPWVKKIVFCFQRQRLHQSQFITWLRDGHKTQILTNTVTHDPIPHYGNWSRDGY